MRMTVLISLLALGAAVCKAAVPGDAVKRLPGWTQPLPAPMYSGYLEAGGGKHLHYLLSVSEKAPATDPLVFWFNGGPGCSSLDGFFYEHGAFHVTEPIVNTTDGVPKLELNPYRWSSMANVLFLESPAGVGFSYADTKNGTSHTDSSTARDNFAVLQDFLKKFPEFQGNKFFVAGESYAGAYVPMLALQVLEHNDAVEASSTVGQKINLNGILVGNGVTGAGSIPNAVAESLAVDFYYGHGLFSAKLYKQIQKACGDFSSESQPCDSLLDTMHSTIGHVNVYDLYMPCIMAMDEKQQPLRAELPTRSHQRALDLGLGGPDGCIDAGAATKYLDNPVVQTALHVTVAKKDWHICGGIDYNSDSGSLLPFYKSKLIPNIRVLIFNGDVDACVPYVGNEWWTSSLEIPEVAPWHAWLVDDQVAGYMTSYVSADDYKSHGLTFLTVKGSGHMVPQFRPKQAFAMFARFVGAMPLDCTSC